jgi:hypothetical protein
MIKMTNPLFLLQPSFINYNLRYHVDLINEALALFGIKSVGVYGKMSQLDRKLQIQEVKCL